MHLTPQVNKGAISKQESNNLNDLNRTLDNIKNGENFEAKLSMGRKGGCSLHETDLFKIAVRNLTEQDILANFGAVQNDEQRSAKVSILLIFYRVWCGYVKFLNNQVITKSKLV
jgi:hypothetical protein